MAGHNDASGPDPLQSSHRPQPHLQPTVIRLYGIDGEPLNVLDRAGQNLVEHPRVDMGSIGHRLGRLGPGRHEWLRAKNRLPAWASLRGQTNTSTTWPNWSTARFQ
jgi:hypothetical protein